MSNASSDLRCCGKSKRADEFSYIRVLHAAPNSPAVNIYLNDELIVQNLAYSQYSLYIPLAPGDYSFKAYPVGQNENPIINTTVIIPEKTVFNLAIIGTAPNLEVYPIPEPTTAQNFGRPCVRFINLSPNSPALDVTIQNGMKIFYNVGYKYISNYACTTSGTYIFKVSPTGTNNVIAATPPLQLVPNKYYSIYAIGLVDESPALQAMTIPEPR
ncbi:MAG: DUF4397 domain-containing protein [Bacillota bacterium]|nr:DUF4397 domain-containing protein [Bacillota bacterium]